MKTLPPCLGWLLLAVAATATASSVRAQVPPMRQGVDLITRPDQTAYGKLDGHGKLVFQELYQDGLSAYWHDTLVYYPQGSRWGVKLRRNLRAMNVFLAAEVRRPKTVQNFLKEHLWYFLQGNLGTSVIDASVITRRGIEGVADESLVEADRRSAARRARRLAQLQAYARPDELVAVKGNGWTVDANVIAGDGAVEHWLVRGTVQPLQIGSFLCELKEPGGTFEPTPVWR